MARPLSVSLSACVRADGGGAGVVVAGDAGGGAVTTVVAVGIDDEVDTAGRVVLVVLVVLVVDEVVVGAERACGELPHDDGARAATTAMTAMNGPDAIRRCVTIRVSRSARALRDRRRTAGRSWSRRYGAVVRSAVLELVWCDVGHDHP
jgi:hypothetical protein